MSKIKPISECFIKPEFEIEDSKRKYYLSPVQLSMLPLNYIHIGYLFKKPYNYSPSTHLERLKFTLSKALVHFYPLAGRLETDASINEHSCCIYVDYDKGPGAKLIHAGASNISIGNVISMKSEYPAVVRFLLDLGEGGVVNYDGHTRPLLTIQLTELADGVFLGLSVNHSVVDGSSFTHFLQTWSSIFMESTSSFSRPLFLNPGFLDVPKIVKLPYVDQCEFITRSSYTEPQFRERLFNVSIASMKILKAMANKEPSSDGTYEPISSYKALCGFIWRCITRARHIPPEEVTTCGLAVNLRHRLNPPLSQHYFGNYFTRVKASAKVCELQENGLNWAATMLHRALLQLDDKAARAMFELAANEGPELYRRSTSSNSNNIVIAGSPMFNYMPEFGLGAVVCARSGYGNKYDGKVDSYMGFEGQGSVLLDICLAPETMSSLLLDQEFMAMAITSHDNGDIASRI